MQPPLGRSILGILPVVMLAIGLAGGCDDRGRNAAAEAAPAGAGMSQTGTSDTGTSEMGTSDTGTSDTGTSEMGTSDPSAPAPAAGGSASPAPGQPLGPLHEVTVTDLDGKPFSFAALAGRPMIIEVWATWCGPCLQNRQLVHSLKDKFPPRLAVVGVSVDAGRVVGGRNTAADVVRNFLRSRPANEFEFLATPDFQAFVRKLNPSGLIPKTIYVDSRGRVADLSEGVQSQQWLLAMAKNLK